MLYNLKDTLSYFNSFLFFYLGRYWRENVKNNESHIFYINHLLERCENSYYESLAKPLTFSQAKKLILSIENPTTQSTISQIAFELNFEDNSYFTKFFKSNAGVSPIDFRKNLNK